MTALRISSLLAFGALSGCATYHSIPDGYDGPTAIILDSEESKSSFLGYFYYVAEIDGHRVTNNLSNTTQLNAGKGIIMKIAGGQRAVPAGEVRLTIEAASHHAAPVLALGGSNYDLTADVALNASPNGNYVVKGELGSEHCAVWIEDESTHEVVTPKIEKPGC